MAEKRPATSPTSPDSNQLAASVYCKCLDTPQKGPPIISQQNPCPFWVIIPPVNPLDDYSYTPPYTSPTISPLLPHYQYQYRNNRLPHPYKRIIPILPTTIPQISPLLPHYQDQYRNNQLPHPYSLRWYYYPKWARVLSQILLGLVSKVVTIIELYSITSYEMCLHYTHGFNSLFRLSLYAFIPSRHSQQVTVVLYCIKYLPVLQ